MNNVADIVRRELEARAGLLASLDAEAVAHVGAMAAALVDCLRGGGVVYACGNGGSATQASHFAAELVGRFKQERRALPAFALVDNAAVVTSIANDYSFDDVFARQLQGIARAGDCLLALSTSGNSPNVVRACRAARERGARVLALTGAGGGEVARHGDIVLAVPSTDTPHIQELHLVVIHMLCRIVESELFPSS